MSCDCWHLACRYRRNRWSPQNDDLDNLYENTDTPYQWELKENPPPAPVGGDTDGAAPVISSGNSVDVRVKENGDVSS